MFKRPIRRVSGSTSPFVFAAFRSLERDEIIPIDPVLQAVDGRLGFSEARAPICKEAIEDRTVAGLDPKVGIQARRLVGDFDFVSLGVFIALAEEGTSIFDGRVQSQRDAAQSHLARNEFSFCERFALDPTAHQATCQNHEACQKCDAPEHHGQGNRADMEVANHGRLGLFSFFAASPGGACGGASGGIQNCTSIGAPPIGS